VGVRYQDEVEIVVATTRAAPAQLERRISPPAFGERSGIESLLDALLRVDL
jgi:hypothetical protein